MKKTITIIGFAFTVVMFGCSISANSLKIKENHLLFENFRDDKGKEFENIYLLCQYQKPIKWIATRQFEAGAHSLWVHVMFQDRDNRMAQRVSYINFDVSLAQNKRYMLNRKVNENQISVWIQEVETGQVVSPIKMANLTRPLIHGSTKIFKMCKSSTI